MENIRTRFVLPLLLCLFSLGLTAQTYTGTVVDSEGLGLPNAQLVFRTGQEIKGFSITDANGDFTLEFPASLTDSTVLEVRYFGFATTLIPANQITEAKLRKIVLRDEAVELKEVVVSANILPQVTRGDTIAFNTKAYSDGSEDKIEDLLAKLPGIEVDDNGKIKVQGKPLDRILIDGEDLFDKDYKLLSRNVPADFVTRIEVMPNYQTDALVGDLEGQGGVALNLKLDPSKNGIAFGELNGKLGSANSSFVQSNFFHLGKKVKTINFSDYSTLGAASSAGGDLLLKSQGLGSRQPSAGQGILSSAAARRNRLVRPIDYLNNKTFGTAQSMLFDVGRNAKNRLLFNVLHDEFKFNEQQLRETVTELGVDSFRQQSQQTYQSTRIWIKNDLNATLSRNSRIDVRASLSGNLTKAGTQIINKTLSSGTVDELGTNLRETPLNHLLSLRYVRRMKEGLALRLVANWQVDSYDQQQAYRGSVYNDIFPLQDAPVVDQLMNQQTRNLDFEANILHRFSGNKLEYSLGQRNVRSAIVSGLDPSEGAGISAVNLTKYNLSESYLKTSWARKWERLQASGGLTGSFFDLDNSLESGRTTTFVLQGQADLNYQLNARNKVRVWANDRRKAPQAEQTIRSPFLADGTTLSLGLDSNYLIREYAFGLDYAYNNQFSQYGYGLRLFRTVTPNAIQSSLLVDNFIIVNQLLPGATSALNSAVANLNFYLPEHKTHVKTNLSVTQVQNQLDFGQEELLVSSLNYRLGLWVNTQFTKSFKYGLYTAYDIYQNELGDERSNQSQLFIGNKGVVILNKNLKAIFRYDMYLPQLGQDSRAVQLLSFESTWSISDSNWEVGLGGANLLNQGMVIERSISSYQRFTRAYSLRPRSIYMMASWSF
jgi:hypothetical protein